MSVQVTQYNVYQQLTSVRVVDTSNLSGSYLNGPLNNGVQATLTANSAAALVIDGVTLLQYERVLLVGQSNANENGIYIVTNPGSASALWVLTRSADQQNIEQIKAGQFIPVDAGTANAGAIYVLVEPLPAELGVDDLNFSPSSVPSGSTFLVAANNLSDVVSASTSATNLGLGSASDVTFNSLTVSNTGLKILDTNASNTLSIVPGSNLTADRALTITTGDVARTLDISAANVTVSAYAAGLVSSATKLTALTALGVKRGTTAAYAGGGTSNAYVATGLVSTDIVVATILASTNAVSICKAVPSADTLTITFSADPGAATTVQWHAIATV